MCCVYLKCPTSLITADGRQQCNMPISTEKTPIWTAKWCTNMFNIADIVSEYLKMFFSMWCGYSTPPLTWCIVCFATIDWMLYVFPDTKVADKENQHSMAPLHFIAAYIHVSWKRNSFVHHFQRTDEEDLYLTSDRTRCATFDFP